MTNLTAPAPSKAPAKGAPDARSEEQILLAELVNEPRPLISLQYDIGLIWSAKSACTKVLAWYLKLHGLLPAAQFYHRWPHIFRVQVLYNTATYKQWLDEVDVDQLRWYQFVRDPVKRALSSYRHNLRFGYCDHVISTLIGREIKRHEGFSLNEFLTYLSRLNLRRCDIHVKSQMHPFSGRATIINVDEQDLYKELNKIEIALGLEPTDFAGDPAFSAIDSMHNAKLAAADRIDPDHRYRRADTLKDWPVTVDTIDASTRERIESLYSADINFLNRRRAG